MEFIVFMRSFNIITVLIRLVLSALFGGIIGMDSAVVVERMRSHLPIPFKAASGVCRADGVIFTLDTVSGRVTDVKSVEF